MKTEVIEYQCDGKLLKGYLAYDELIVGARPCVLVAHAWKGQDNFAKKKAEDLAAMGYVGFATDVFGDGETVESDEDAFAMITPLFINRQLLRDRMNAGYDCIVKNPLVDSQNIGAIGFCFGGLSVLELFKSGARLKGAVSFHGLLGNTLADLKANIPPLSNELQGSLLVLHGHLDPLVTPQHIREFETEMTHANVDWQMHTYGTATHAFSNPEANSPDGGLLYNQCADQRSWHSMKNFFQERFDKGDLK